NVSKFGTDYATIGGAGFMLGLGKFTANERLSRAGARGIEAGINAALVAQGLKLLTQRKRPYLGGDGSFGNGGNSFPSGHSAQVWALAKVVSDEYSEKPLVKFGMYSFATAVSLSRISGQRHFPSDVLIGSAIGYLI